MAIKIRTESFPENLGKIQISTLFQVGETADFTQESNLLQEVEGTIENKMLNVGIINLIQPENVIWYTRFKRFFDNNTESEWSNPEPIYGSDLNNTRFIKFDSSINRPSVKVFLDTASLTIEVSEALIDGADGHLYTSYLVYSNGEIKYSSMENRDDLNSLTIPITEFNYKLYNNITVMAIQGTANGAESAVATAMVSNSKLSFLLNGTFSNIPYNRGQRFILTSETNSVVVSDARVYAGTGESLGEMNKLVFANNTDGLTRYSEIFLNSIILDPSSIYTLRLTATSIIDPSIVENFDYVITTDDIDSGFIIDREYEYRETITAKFNSNTGLLPVTSEESDFTMCYASNYRDVLLSSTGLPNSLSVFTFYPNTLAFKIDKDIDLNILNIPGKKVVFFTKDRKVIIAAAESNSELKVIKCSYNPFDNTKLVKESTMIYSSYNALNIVEKNAIVLNNQETHLYCLEKTEISSEFFRIDLSDMSREILSPRPNMTGVSTLSVVDDNKIISIRGSDDLKDFFIYNTKENLWSPYQANFPEDPKYLNCFNSVLRKDGRVALFPAKNSTAQNYLVLDIEEKNYTEHTIDMSIDYVVDNIVRQADGSFVLITSNAYDRTDKTVCYLY